KTGSNPETAPGITVIGVVGDVRHFALEADARPEMYRTDAVNPVGAPNVVVRARADGGSLISALRPRIGAVDRSVPTYSASWQYTRGWRSTAQRRLVMLLLASFGMAALLVAGVGVYGMMSQAVAQRTAEIGLRRALGASQSAVLGLVFRQG